MPKTFKKDLRLASDHRIGNIFCNFCNVFVWALSDLLVMLTFLLFWPIVYKPLWNILYLDLSFMKQWVFSQVSRFSFEPPILIFEFPIQSGESSSLILEPPSSGVISSRSAKPSIDVLHFFPFRLGFIPIFVQDEIQPQIRDDHSSSYDLLLESSSSVVVPMEHTLCSWTVGYHPCPYVILPFVGAQPPDYLLQVLILNLFH